MAHSAQRENKLKRTHTMNKKIFSTLVLFALVLTACTPTAKTTGIASSRRASNVGLPAQTKLILGAIKLEETDYVVTAEQAAELLPMFYVLQELNESKSTAQDEMDGLVSQIQETMTKDQLQAIDDMSLSMQDVLTLTQGSGKSFSKASSTTSPNTGGGSAGGPPDMGGMPGDPGGMPSGTIPSTGTTSASSSSNAGSVLIMDTSTPSALFDAAIELLKKKIE